MVFLFNGLLFSSISARIKARSGSILSSIYWIIQTTDVFNIKIDSNFSGGCRQVVHNLFKAPVLTNILSDMYRLFVQATISHSINCHLCLNAWSGWKFGQSWKPLVLWQKVIKHFQIFNDAVHIKLKFHNTWRIEIPTWMDSICVLRLWTFFRSVVNPSYFFEVRESLRKIVLVLWSTSDMRAKMEFCSSDISWWQIVKCSWIRWTNRDI